MKKVEVDRDLLYHYYVEENHNIEETANLMNLKYRTVQRAIKEFDFNKDKSKISQQRKQHNKDLYGVENVYQLKDSIDKIKQTKLKRYNNENYNNPEKHKQTMIERYNTASSLKLPGVRDKIEKLYGGLGWSSEIIQNKIKQTNLEKYGSIWYITSDDAQNKKKSGNIVSKPNKAFADLLRKNGIFTEYEFRYNKEYSFDLHILDSNILIEINPTYTHNSTVGAFFFGENQKLPLDPNYHYNKCLSAINNGYQLISVFEWMDVNKVLDIIKAKMYMLNYKISGHKCKIMEISQHEANNFLDLYHIQGGASHQSICIGLYYNDELVQVQTFGKPRYNNRYDYEAIRLASKSNTYIIGGVTKGFNYFINKYNPRSIISYNSLNISQGGTDKLQGFKNLGYSKSQGIFVNIKRNNNPKYIRSSTLRYLGIDKILNKPREDFPDYDGTYETSNEFLLIKEGYVKVYDCGNVTYLWTKEHNI